MTTLGPSNANGLSPVQDVTRRDQDHRYPLCESQVESLDTLGKIQVKRHAPPPGELVWAAEMTKMPAPGSGKELFDSRKTKDADRLTMRLAAGWAVVAHAASARDQGRSGVFWMA
ncbi:hypothetical protein [Rhizobium sp. PEPV16]|uniref:hypothetical protein n=1 Tax=Rhizobium sp. PEPV16 TaxID=1820614 RepID=UPI0015E197F0|nr:hypothetical protein [Rhizobium sp. PEPV16]KAF5880387.1 hypothetical protein FY112_34320 [Rhizobium sp. PEPV16]